MNTTRSSKLLVFGLVALIGLLSILAPLFPINTIADKYLNLYSYSYRTIAETDLGYDFLAFDDTNIVNADSSYGWAIIVIGIVVLFLLLSGITALVLGLVFMFAPGSGKGVAITFATLCESFAFLYMIAGIVMSAINFDYYDISYTLAFIPFILITGAYVCFWIFSVRLSAPKSYKGLVDAPDLNNIVDINQQRQIAQSAGAQMGALYCVQGSVGKSLVVYENKCVISTKATVRSVIAGNFADGNKTIYFADMTGIQFKLASGLLLGYLQFETASQASRLAGSWAANYGSENSFTFEANINGLMEEISQYVTIRLEEYKEGKAHAVPHAPTPVAQPQPAPTVAQPSAEKVVITQSIADQLVKLKELLDSGIITQQEFDQMKKDLLKN